VQLLFALDLAGVGLVFLVVGTTGLHSGLVPKAVLVSLLLSSALRSAGVFAAPRRAGWGARRAGRGHGWDS